MAWLPISGTLPQYSTANNDLANDYYLKFYESGTTTPTNMATDSTGGTTLAKCALSADGYPISNPLDDSTKFIPHIDKDYRVVLYTNETDADNNTTANAAFNIDGMVLQAVVTGDAADITVRDETLEEYDDYDRSPLFTDGDGFTAGAGPHVITVPSDWTPSNSDMRFYKLDNGGVVSALTPTATTSTTFTLAETLLSTDTIYLGDDTFRESFRRPATTTEIGMVEEATDAEMSAGTEAKFPDCDTIKTYYGEYEETTVDVASSGDFISGIINIHKVGKQVTMYVYDSGLLHNSGSQPSTASGLIPSEYRPSGTVGTVTSISATNVKIVNIKDDGTVLFQYRDWAGGSYNSTLTNAFTITYIVGSKT